MCHRIAQEPNPEEELIRRGRQAEKLVHQGEVSRARQALCSLARAPSNVATLKEFRDPVRRPAQLSEAIPIEISQHVLASPPVRVGPGEVRKQPPQHTQRFSQQGWQVIQMNITR